MSAPVPADGGQPRVPGHPGVAGAHRARQVALVARVATCLAEMAAAVAELAEIGLAQPDESRLMTMGPMITAEKSTKTAGGDKRPELMTQSEVADFLRCSPKTVRRMELGGDIPPAQGSGRRKRWRRHEIEACSGIERTKGRRA